MKTNKKGFTLIELLAVIVILAIILLIATPIILNVIEDARKGAAKSSAMFFISQVEKQVMQDEVTGKKPTDADAVLAADGKVNMSKVTVRGNTADAFTTGTDTNALKYVNGKVNGDLTVKSGNQTYNFTVTDGNVNFK